MEFLIARSSSIRNIEKPIENCFEKRFDMIEVYLYDNFEKFNERYGILKILKQ